VRGLPEAVHVKEEGAGDLVDLVSSSALGSRTTSRMHSDSVDGDCRGATDSTDLQVQTS